MNVYLFINIITGSSFQAIGNSASIAFSNYTGDCYTLELSKVWQYSIVDTSRDYQKMYPDIYYLD